MSSVGQELKALLAGPEILITPGIYDGYSARLVEKAGFRTAGISGAGTSESRLGWPDRGLMGFEENLRNARAIADCSGLLLLADADTGYGNAVNVYFVVRAFEKAGMAGVMIEDQVWPKRCGHMSGKTVVAAEEMVEKIEAAVDARQDKDFVIKARTDAATPLGVREAIRRLNLYAEAGADCLFADALSSVEEIETVARNVDKPLSVNMGLGIRSRATTPLIAPGELKAMGVAQITYPRMLSTAAVMGMSMALTVFKEEVVDGDAVVDRADLQVSFEELNDLMGVALIDDLERRYVRQAKSDNG